MKPNIFELATKELSQDAFFTWLLQWADSSNEVYDSSLHKCAKNFVEILIFKHFDYNKPIQKVTAGRQWENIDIWAEINDEILIIIEDKTYTIQHSNQLESYFKIAEEYCVEKKMKLVPIYLKTGSESLSSLQNVTKQRFKIFDRKEIVNFLNTHIDIENDIFNDFKNRIVGIENKTNAYHKLKIKDWDWNTWEGFYIFLQESIKVQDWRYVSNPRGGFLGLWWHFLQWKDYYVYLQIEQGNLCFKIGEVFQNRSAVRNEWYDILIKNASQNSSLGINKPIRFGNGTYMTVALIDRKDWLGDDNSIVDLDLVVNRLKEYEKFLK